MLAAALIIAATLNQSIDTAAARVEGNVIATRRDIHQHPELGNREVRTAKVVADHLRALGFDSVQEKVAHTGVVGVLKGGLPGPVVALRADMDALPVAEEVDVPFKSKVRAQWNGMDCGVRKVRARRHRVSSSPSWMGVSTPLASLRPLR